MAITKGQHLIGKMLGSCLLERLLGYGGSSAVFLAQQTSPERKVAVKVFLPRASMDRRMQRDFYRRFLREAEAASKLDHPNILPVYSYGEQEGLPYIVMPYMPGGTLAQYMAKRGPLSLPEAQWYLEQLASALNYAHEHGCVHCDVKPANILLDSAGHVILSDFGIARITQIESDPERTEIKYTGPGAVLGTPDYISPEQALAHPLDGRSDIYSLGVTLFFLLSKRLPFKADSAIALALLHVHEDPPSLALLRADVTPAVDHVIHTALAKDPDERFQSAIEFSECFADAITASKKKPAIARNKYAENLSLDIGRDGPFTPQPVVVVTKPIVRGHMLWERKINTARLLVSCIVLLAIIAVAGMAVISLAGGASHRSLAAKPTVVPTVRPTSIDLLADANNWPTSSTFFFNQREHSYHILNKSANSIALAPYYNHSFQDFRLTVTTREVHSANDGSDYYGVVFRAATDQSQYYLFEIAPEDNEQYAFLRYDGNTGNWVPLSSGSATSLVAGVGATNTITVEGRGNTFTFFVNGKVVGNAVSDASGHAPLLSGLIGLYVENDGTEVAFSQLSVTKLH